MNEALYRLLKSALLFYKKLCSNIGAVSFKVNPYITRMAKGKCRISLSTKSLLGEYLTPSDLPSIKMIAETSRIHF